ncbi:hypothetical protein SDJN02_23850, partial [Cucurbita argyrosperma subsp. argyrosperma]
MQTQRPKTTLYRSSVTMPITHLRNLDVVGVTNYTFNLTHTSTIECLHYARRLEGEETINPEFKNRYSDCSKHINSSLPDVETAQYCMGYHT